MTFANFQLTPELRHRSGKLKGNVTAIRRACHNGYNSALFRLIVSLVSHHQSLTGLDTARHRDQSAGSIDRNRAGFFMEWISCRRVTVNEQGNMDVHARRSSAIGMPSKNCPGGFGVCAFGKVGFGPPQYPEDFMCDPHSGTRSPKNQLKNNYSRFLRGRKTPIQQTKCSTILSLASQWPIVRSLFN
jgi:hypothetical protein